MARNGSGEYVQPVEDFVQGVDSSADDVNTYLTDLGNEITNSVARDGQAPWTGDQDANGNAIILDVDGDSKAEMSTDDVWDITLGGSLALSLNSTKASALNNYVSTTFTPTVVDPSANAATLSTALGSYTRLGNRVWGETNVVISNLGSASGHVRIGALPITSSNSLSGTSFPATVIASGLSITATESLVAAIPANSSQIWLYIWDDSEGVRLFNFTDIVAGSSSINVSFCYVV